MAKQSITQTGPGGQPQRSGQAGKSDGSRGTDPRDDRGGSLSPGGPKAAKTVDGKVATGGENENRGSEDGPKR